MGGSATSGKIFRKIYINTKSEILSIDETKRLENAKKQARRLLHLLPRQDIVEKEEKTGPIIDINTIRLKQKSNTLSNTGDSVSFDDRLMVVRIIAGMLILGLMIFIVALILFYLKWSPQL